MLSQDDPAGPDLRDALLWVASQEGRAADVHALLAAGAFDRHALGNALAVAAANNHAGVAEVLIRNGAEASYKNERFPQGAPLYCAAFFGSAEAARVLVQAGADVNSQSNSPLFAAARCGHPDIVQLLLDANSDIAQGEYSPLLAAATRRGDIGIVRMLLDAKADANRPSGAYQRHPPMCAAARCNRSDILELLIAAKGSVDARSGFKASPILLAAEHGCFEALQTLHRHGARYQAARSRRGGTAHAAAALPSQFSGPPSPTS